MILHSLDISDILMENKVRNLTPIIEWGGSLPAVSEWAREETRWGCGEREGASLFPQWGKRFGSGASRGAWRKGRGVNALGVVPGEGRGVKVVARGWSGSVAFRLA